MSIIIFSSANLNNLMLLKVKKLKNLGRGEEYQSNLLDNTLFQIIFHAIKI